MAIRAGLTVRRRNAQSSRKLGLSDFYGIVASWLQALQAGLPQSSADNIVVLSSNSTWPFRPPPRTSLSSGSSAVPREHSPLRTSFSTSSHFDEMPQSSANPLIIYSTLSIPSMPQSCAALCVLTRCYESFANLHFPSSVNPTILHNPAHSSYPLLHFKHPRPYYCA